MTTDPHVQIEVTVAERQLILNVLMDQPYRHVAGLITKIAQQGQRPQIVREHEPQATEPEAS